MKMSLFGLIAAASMCLSPVSLHAASIPEAGVENAVAVVRGLHEALESAPETGGRYELLEPVVEASHNLPYISRFVLRRAWSSVSEEQRESFIILFKRLSVMNYASRFGDLAPGSFHISGAEQNGRRVQVNATLETENRTVEFAYTLDDGGGQWRIINVMADGVSDLALRRYEYSRELEENGFDGLLDHVRAQIADLEADG